jgi:hypothetical protein
LPGRLFATGIAWTGLFVLPLLSGCSTVRVTDPPSTADEQYLQTHALMESISKLSFAALRDYSCYVDSTYLFDGNFPTSEESFLLGELRNRMLIEGVSLANSYDEAEIIVEVRSAGIGINRGELLIGLPGVSVPVGSVDVGSVEAPVIIPELSIVKRRRQDGHASVAITAFWKDTGDLVATSGPTYGYTERVDYWFFGLGPQTSGDVPTVVRE